MNVAESQMSSTTGVPDHRGRSLERVNWDSATMAGGDNKLSLHTPSPHRPPPPPPAYRTFGSASPLGLCCTAVTLMIDSFINTGANGIKIPQYVVSVALAYGGVVQVLAGMWEFACGNSFTGTVYSSYGGFWISYGIILSSWSGIPQSFSTFDEYERAIGMYYFAWMIMTVVFLIAAHRSSVVLVGLFICLTLCFLFLGVAKFYPETTAILTMGGVFGILTSVSAWYLALGGLLPPGSLISLPVGLLS